MLTRTRLLTAGIIVILWFSIRPALAANSYWNNPAGGSFNAAANWTPAPPGPGDLVYFSSNANYQITWDNSATNAVAHVTSGTVTNSIGSSTWFLTSQYEVGNQPGSTGAVVQVSGTLIVTNGAGHGTISSGQSGVAGHFNLAGGTAITDYLDYSDDGASGLSRFLSYGTLTTLHGSGVFVGQDLVFTYQGGKTGVWNMLGGTNTFVSTSPALLYTQLGWAYDSQYTINVSGPSTVWSNVLYLVVGNTGASNQVNISQGAKVFSEDTWIGRYGSSDSVTVDGTNSSWTIQTNYFGLLRGNGQLFLSENATRCQLIITNGGQVNCGLVTITRYTSGSSNLATVTGPGSLWNISSNLVVGDYGTGNGVTVSNGGQIYSLITYLGGSASSTATGAAIGNWMAVSDTNSLLACTGVRVGSFAGKNSFVLANAGHVQSSGSLVIGSQSAASNNAVLITGAGTVWTNSSVLTHGSFGSSNSLVVSAGAQLYNTRGIVGASSSNNIAIVTGKNSLWNNSTELWVGNSANAVKNQLIVSAGGTITTANLLVGVTSSALNNSVLLSDGNVFATNSTQTGTVDVRRGTFTLSGGLLRTDRLLLTNGTSSQFNFIAGQIDARSSTVNNTQPLIVGSGAHFANLNLTGGTHAFGNGLTISSNAWLTGGGNISATVSSAGVVAPGHTAGTLNISGDLQLQPSADVVFDIAGYNPGSTFTFLTVSGATTWNGRLHVTFGAGFTPAQSDVFTVAQSGSDSGTFINVASGGTLVTEDGAGSFTVTYGNGLLQLSNFQTVPPAASALKLSAARNNSSVTLQFPFAFGNTYHLWFSSDLNTWIELSTIDYTFSQPGVAQWTDDGSQTGSPPFAQSSRFYKISVDQ
jgi:T5SS/PEP-CTERM-associated repeat protein